MSAMKMLLVVIVAGFVLLSMPGVAGAILWDRGGGLVYDDYLDITWLQDPNYAKTSGTALPCAAGAPECAPILGAMP
jgi:hypothetical protein